MKIFLILVLALHVLAEGGLGLALVANPETVAAQVGLSHVMILTTYGFAGITMAIAVAWLWPQRRNVAVLGTVLGILATFHTAIALSMLVAFARGGDLSGAITHGVFALCFWVLWAKRQQLANA